MISLLTSYSKPKSKTKLEYFCRVSYTTRQHSKRLINIQEKKTHRMHSNEETQKFTNALASISYYSISFIQHFFLLAVFNRPIQQIPNESENCLVSNVFASVHDILSESLSRSNYFSRLSLNAEAEEECVRPRMNRNIMYFSFVKEMNKNRATTGYRNEKWKWKKMYRLPTEREERRRKKIPIQIRKSERFMS